MESLYVTSNQSHLGQKQRIFALLGAEIHCFTVQVELHSNKLQIVYCVIESNDNSEGIENGGSMLYGRDGGAKGLGPPNFLRLFWRGMARVNKKLSLAPLPN